jgi:hypothetical protein
MVMHFIAPDQSDQGEIAENSRYEGTYGTSEKKIPCKQPEIDGTETSEEHPQLDPPQEYNEDAKDNHYHKGRYAGRNNDLL